MSKSLLRVRLGYFWLRRVGGVGRVINGVIMRLDGVRTVPLPSRGRTDQKENILHDERGGGGVSRMRVSGIET